MSADHLAPPEGPMSETTEIAEIEKRLRSLGWEMESARFQAWRLYHDAGLRLAVPPSAPAPEAKRFVRTFSGPTSFGQITVPEERKEQQRKIVPVWCEKGYYRIRGGQVQIDTRKSDRRSSPAPEARTLSEAARKAFTGWDWTQDHLSPRNAAVLLRVADAEMAARIDKLPRAPDPAYAYTAPGPARPSNFVHAPSLLAALTGAPHA